jgi:ribosomal protein S8
MIGRGFFFLGLVLVLASCHKTNQVYDKPYVDFDSLINSQISSLVKANSSLTKSVVLDGKSDQSTITIDSAIVAHELDVFRQLDFINKPLYRKGYEVIDGEKDTHSNLTTRKYQAKNTSPIPIVIFYYQNNFSNIKKIESVYQEDNTLYSTRRELLLEFDDASGTKLLTRYSLKGIQKMILNDTVMFSIEGSFTPGLH